MFNTTLHRHRSLASRVDTPAVGIRVYVLKIWFNYCYLIVNERVKQAVAIDPAWNSTVFENILRDENVSLESVIVTHSHFDHMNLAGRFSRKHDCSVLMSREEVDFYHVSLNNLQCVSNSSSIETAGLSIQTLFTPGHTYGGICLYVNNCLFSGDTLFAEGCGMCTGFGADPQRMYNSLNLLRETLPKTTQVYPGHSYGCAPGATLTELSQFNVYLQIENIERFVEFRMRKGQRRLLDFK